jgi:hypothetical protein
MGEMVIRKIPVENLNPAKYNPAMERGVWFPSASVMETAHHTKR